MTDGIMLALIFFDLFGSGGEGESGPGERGTVLADHVTGFVAVFFVVLQKNFNRPDRHGAVAEDWETRNLA